MGNEVGQRQKIGIRIKIGGRGAFYRFDCKRLVILSDDADGFHILKMFTETPVAIGTVHRLICAWLSGHIEDAHNKDNGLDYKHGI